MEDLSKYTKIELQKLGNDIKVKYDKLKEELIINTYDMENLEKEINHKAMLMTKLEKNYVDIVEKLIE